LPVELTTYKVLSAQQSTYLQFNFLPPFQSALYYWPVSSECSQTENRIWPSCLLLCSSTKLKPNTSCH